MAGARRLVITSGEETIMSGPLQGIKVVDLSIVISGPMATMMLADQGADVIKVEMPGGDMTRRLGPHKDDLSAMFITANRHKRSIVLDLKADAAKAVLADLIAGADVLVENFRPGALERLGFGYAAMAARNPRLIYCSISGYGQDGPMAGARVYDPIIQAVSGIASTQRDRQSNAPQLLQGLICDKLTALTAAQAISAALFARERAGGQGQKLELAMLDAALNFLWPEGMYNHTFLNDVAPPAPDFGAFYRLWPAKDGWMALAAVQDDEFRAMCEALDLMEMRDDPRFQTATGRMANAGEMLKSMGGAIASQPADALMARFLETDAPGAKVNERPDLPHDPQVVHNGAIVEFDNGPVGRVRGPRHPTRFKQTPARAPVAAPRLGEHSRAILGELGRDAATIEALLASGAVKGA
jgi:crotonobetainyl-CoA:carnitine CoA-transferase CaiB-like acyl-CoA transferase